MNKKIYDLLGKYDEAGYDREGFNRKGYDRDGFSRFQKFAKPQNKSIRNYFKNTIIIDGKTKTKLLGIHEMWQGA